MDLASLGIGPEDAARLARAGVASAADLAAADASDVARRADLPVARVRRWQEEARRLAPGGGVRVVLDAGGVRARVFDGAAWRTDLPLVTVTLAEDEDVVMREQVHDVVLLKERAPGAFVRLDGAWLGGVPIYRVRASPEGEREVRVTVEAVRERRRGGDG